MLVTRFGLGGLIGAEQDDHLVVGERLDVDWRRCRDQANGVGPQAEVCNCVDDNCKI